MASVLFLFLFVTLQRCGAADRAHAALLSGHIPEDAPRGTAVRGLLLPRCAGADPDVSLTGDHSTNFRLVPRAHRTETRLALVSTRTLDREFIAMYELHAHLPARCQTRRARMQVEVTDVNDNEPHFTTGNRTVDVDALTPLGTELTRFNARDADAERNGRVMFYISPRVPQLHVVPGSGQVLLVDSLLGLERITARVFVEDDGEPPRAGEPVFLHVNVRSGPPTTRTRRALLEELTYTVKVPARVRVGQLLFTLPPRFEQRRVELLSSAAPVTVERDTGRIYLARTLTRDEEVTVRVHNLRGQ
ncbi:hypothetical protein NL108_013060 [Boleophthalmus pectinirostris]|nr:hypothetical protein NL108_013060 [Boleophthalmus pectinirostris]